jgi:hypothetical protein
VPVPVCTRAGDDRTGEERESSRHAADDVIDGSADLGYELLPLRQP